MYISTTEYKTSIDFEIKTYDIDVAGHVNNIVYVRWLEDLRNKLFSLTLPVEDLLKEKFYTVVTSTVINYKKQLKLGDKPIGTMNVEYVKHGLMNLHFNFVNRGSTCVQGEQKCVIMNLDSGLMDKEKLNLIFNE